MEGSLIHRSSSYRTEIASFSGGISGLSAVLTGHPFDTLKTHMQTGRSSGSIMDLGGIRGLYRGILPPLLTSGIANAIVFSSYDYARRATAEDGRLGFGQQVFMSGFIAGTVVTAVNTPINVWKIGMQLSPVQSVSAITATKQFLTDTIAKRGFGVLYSSVRLQWINESFGRGVYFCAYEMTKRMLKDEKDVLSVPSRMFAGGMSGILGWMSIYPFDVLKSRMQADALRPKSERLYRNLRDCVRVTYAEGGWGAFYRGATVTSLRAFPVSMVALSVYDLTLDSLDSIVLAAEDSANNSGVASP